MIRTTDGEFVCECNECGDTFYGGCEDDFYGFVQQVRGEGWRITKDDDGEWVHLCPECRD